MRSAVLPRTSRTVSTARWWRRGAELGWVSMLVSEDHGGGCISGQPLADLQLVAEEVGRLVSPGPLIPTNVVAAALSRVGTPAHHKHLAGAGQRGDRRHLVPRAGRASVVGPVPAVSGLWPGVTASSSTALRSRWRPAGRRT